MPPAKHRTSLNLTHEQMKTLRSLAEDLGLFITRGPGANETGNVTALMARLAAAYEADPNRTREQFSRLPR